MKYFTLFMAALMTASVATAATKGGKVHNMNNPQKMAKVQKTEAQGLNINHRELDLSRVHPIVPAAVSRAQDMPIYDVEGEPQAYTVYSLGFANMIGGLYFDPFTDMKNVVWGDDGCVYIQNFVAMGEDTYVQGTYKDGKITVEFPQPIVYYEDWETGEVLNLYLNILQYDENAEYMYKNALLLKNSLAIDVAEDGTMSWNLNPDYSYEMFFEDGSLPKYIIGLTENTKVGVSDWYGFGDCEQTYTPFNDQTITPPETAIFDQWVLKYTNDNESMQAQFVDVAFDGDDIYIGGFDPDLDGWIKGTVSDGKAFFENAQYIGYYDMYSTPIYVFTGTFEEFYIEEDDAWDFNIELTEGATFDYNPQAKTLTCIEPGTCLILSDNVEELFYMNIFIDPEIFWQDEALCNANPLNPEFVGFQEWDPEFYGGQGGIFWDIPAINVNGALLDTSRMYYHFLVDGEIYPIDPEEYEFVEEYMEDIPYDYTDGADIWAMGEYHEIYFYLDGAESYGIQSFYVGDDDVVYASEIVTFVPDLSGIDDTKYVQVVDTKYIDLMGREVANPTHGIYIKSMKLANGSTRTVKVIVK